MEKESEAAWLERLTALLRSYGEPRRAAAAQRDKGSKYEFLAIRVPVLRRVATREFALEGADADRKLAIYDYIWTHSNVYEAMSIPLLYYRAKGRRIEDPAFATIRNWIDRVDDWGHCDDLSAIYSYCNHNQPAVVFPFLRELNKSRDVWRIRASIASLVHYTGKNAVYLKPDKVLPMLDRHLENNDKYVANAVGWVLREMRRRYPSQVDRYAADNAQRLSGLARRKART